MGDVAVVDFSGKITLGEGSAMLRKTIRDLIEAGDKKILLTLRRGLHRQLRHRRMVSAYTTVRSASGELKLLHLTKSVHDILQITRLFTVFDVQTEESAAVRSFKA